MVKSLIPTQTLWLHCMDALCTTVPRECEIACRLVPWYGTLK